MKKLLEENIEFTDLENAPEKADQDHSSRAEEVLFLERNISDQEYANREIVDPESSLGKRVQSLLQSCLEQVYTSQDVPEVFNTYDALRSHDFDREPVRFLLSLNPEPNACYTRYQDQDCIIINIGVFDERKIVAHGKSRQEAIVSREIDLVHLLLHEMTHLKLRKLMPELKKNSKLEEGAANLAQIETLSAAGYNPEDLIWTFEKWKSLNRGNKDSWEIISDDHLEADLELDLLKDGLSAIRVSKGTFTGDAGQDIAEWHEWPSLMKEALDLATLGQKSEEIDFKGMNPLQRLEVLKKNYQELETSQLTPLRIKIIARRIAAECKYKGRKTLEYREMIHDFADMILGQMMAPTASLTSSQYRALFSSLAECFSSPSREFRPISRPIQEVQETLDGLHEACARKNSEQISRIAQDIAQHLDKLGDAALVLPLFTWRVFEVPEEQHWLRDGDEEFDSHVDDVEMTADDLEDHLFDQNYYSESSEQVVPWNFLYSLVKRGNKDAQYIAQFIGLDQENRFSDHFQHDQYIDSDHEDNPPVTISGIAGDFQLSDIEVDEEGYVRRAPLLSVDSQAEAEDEGRDTDRYLGKVTPQQRAILEKDLITEQEAGIIEPLINNLEISGFIVEKLVARHFYCFHRNVAASARSYSEDIALDDFYERDRPDSFGDLPASAQPSFSHLLVGSIQHRITQDPERFRPNVLTLVESYPEIASYAANHRSHKHGIEVSPLVEYLSSDPDGIFPSVDKKWHLLLQLPERFSLQFAAYMIEKVGPMAITDSIYEPSNISNGREALELCKKHLGKGSSSKKPQVFFFLAELLLFLSGNAVGFRQGMEIAKLLGPHIKRGDFVNFLRQGISRGAGRILKRKNLSSIIDDLEIIINRRFVSPTRRELLIDGLTERIDLLTDPKERIEKAEQTLSKITIDDQTKRGLLIEIIVEALVEIHGGIADEDRLISSLQPILDGFAKNLSESDRFRLLARLAIRLTAQPKTAYFLQRHLPDVSVDHFYQSARFGGKIEALVKIARNCDEKTQSLLDYLLEEKTLRSKQLIACSFFDDFVNGTQMLIGESYTPLYFDDEEKHALVRNMIENKLASRKLPLSDFEALTEGTSYHALEIKHRFEYDVENLNVTLDNIHAHFWNAPLALRAVFVRELIFGNSSGEEEHTNQVIDDTIRNMARSLWGNEAENTLEPLEAYVAALPQYMKPLSVSALMAAGEKERNSKQKRVGRSIATFAESMGPAEVAVCQVAPGHPDVPDDIAEDLRYLKYNASRETRWNILRIAESAGIDMETRFGFEIQHYGELVGSGKLFYALRVVLSDGRRQILALLRPHSLKRAESGFETMNQAFSQIDPKRAQVFADLSQHAIKSIERETDCLLAEEQYEKGKRMYDGLKIHIGEETFTFVSPSVHASGEIYYMMDELPGEHLIDMNPTPENKHARLADATALIHTLFRLEFDDDRHGGNKKIHRQTIGHFDFKSTNLRTWTDAEIHTAIDLVITVVTDFQSSPKDLSGDLSQIIKSLMVRFDLTSREHNGLLVEVKKALLTAFDNISDFTQEDFKLMIISAVRAGVHPRLEEALLQRLTGIPAVVVSSLLQGNDAFLGLIGVSADSLIRIERPSST